MVAWTLPSGITLLELGSLDLKRPLNLEAFSSNFSKMRKVITATKEVYFTGKGSPNW